MSKSIDIKITVSGVEDWYTDWNDIESTNREVKAIISDVTNAIAEKFGIRKSDVGVEVKIN